MALVEAFAQPSVSPLSPSLSMRVGGRYGAGNGLPFARCQILPKVEEMEEGRQGTARQLARRKGGGGENDGAAANERMGERKAGEVGDPEMVSLLVLNLSIFRYPSIDLL